MKELKLNIHELIDRTEDSELLESVFQILNKTKEYQWSKLTSEQKNEVLEAYKESENADNLIPLEEVLRKMK